jgi:hypothetical protein
MHDPRVGRFFAVDPLASKHPHYSTYGFSGNHVINSVELEGLEDVHTYDLQQDGTFKYVKTYTNNELQTDINRYNYKVNGVISEVVFKNQGLTIKHDKVSQIDGKAYAGKFNSIIPKPIEESNPPAKSINYRQQMIKEAFNEGEYGTAARMYMNGLAQALEGEQGLRNYSKALNNVGTLMKGIKLPFLSGIGEGFSYASMAIDTGLDYKNLSRAEASWNLTVRVGIKALDKKIGKDINKSGGKDITQEAQKIGASQATKSIKGELLIKEDD